MRTVILLPIDQKKLSDLLIHEISPYIALKNKLDAVMCAHILFKNVDTVIPSFLLRNGLKIFSKKE